jgi:hypothetical protein
MVQLSACCCVGLHPTSRSARSLRRRQRAGPRARCCRDCSRCLDTMRTRSRTPVNTRSSRGCSITPVETIGQLRAAAVVHSLLVDCAERRRQWPLCVEAQLRREFRACSVVS